MGHVRDVVDIHAPIERVWDFIVDYARWPEWQTNLIELRDFGGVPGTVGFTYTAVYKGLGRRLEGRFEVTVSEPPRLLEEKGHLPGTGEAKSSTLLEATPDGGTTVTFTLDYQMTGGFLGDIADRLVFEHAMERDFHTSGLTMKELIEAAVPAGTR
ncbi:MAG TPA: SRPBCC family protein [Candidatus Limnocylindrales bacterium]|nr:SRPBCC family protein [Candidatus Limnocylindrales bacterium]